jgi:hypothetical protein
MNDIHELVEEIVGDAERRHHQRAVEYWNALHAVMQWWEELPPNLRQDIEGSGREPWAIVKARRALSFSSPNRA